MALTFQAAVLRNDGSIALARLLQAILAIVVLGIVGSGFPFWNAAGGCSIPSSMNYMFACGVLTLFYTLYLAATTLIARLAFLWNAYAQLSLDALFTIFWIAACAVAKPTCTQFADACANFIALYSGQITWNNLALECSPEQICTCAPYTTSYSTSLKRVSTAAAAKGSEFTGGVKLLGKVAEKQGVGAALVLLFVFTLGFGIYRIVQEKRASSASMKSGQHEPLSSEGKGTGAQES